MSANPTDVQEFIDIVTAVPVRAAVARYVLPGTEDIAAEIQRESLRFNQLYFHLHNNVIGPVLGINQRMGIKTAAQLAELWSDEKQGLNILDGMREAYKNTLDPMVECVNHLQTLIRQFEAKVAEAERAAE